MSTQPGPPPKIAALHGRWRQAEHRLYPLIVSDPEAYEASLRLVRAVADELAEVKRSDDLVTWFDRSEELLVRAAPGARVDVSQVDRDAVAGAAFALRLAELDREAARAAAQERLATARREGRTWVTLQESGLKTPDGVVMPPYHLVEGCLTSPWGLHASVIFDMDANAVVYAVEAVHVDLDSTRWWADDVAPVEARTHADAQSWAASIDELRGRLSHPQA